MSCAVNNDRMLLNVGLFLELTYVQIATFFIHQEVEYMGEIDQETKSTHNFNVLRVLL